MHHMFPEGGTSRDINQVDQHKHSQTFDPKVKVHTRLASELPRWCPMHVCTVMALRCTCACAIVFPTDAVSTYNEYTRSEMGNCCC